jgi:hypothetical protein
LPWLVSLSVDSERFRICESAHVAVHFFLQGCVGVTSAMLATNSPVIGRIGVDVAHL